MTEDLAKRARMLAAIADLRARVYAESQDIPDRCYVSEAEADAYGIEDGEMFDGLIIHIRPPQNG